MEEPTFRTSQEEEGEASQEQEAHLGGSVQESQESQESQEGEELEKGTVEMSAGSSSLPTEAELKRMKLPQLKELLKARKLPVSGTKPVLIQRLLTGDPGKKKGRKRKSEKKEDAGESNSEASPVQSPKKPRKSRQKKKEIENEEGEAQNGEQEEGGAGEDDPDDIVGCLTDEGWKKILAPEFEKSYFKDILKFVAKEKASYRVFPPNKDVFNAFKFTPFDQVKVVVIGQDPYHKFGQAHGLAFSVQKGVTIPPSLRNIYKELERDIPGWKMPNHGCLEAWARQGVLLLNAALTVREAKANSHSRCGWLEFTDAVLRILNEQKKGLIFLLWGTYAQKKGKIVDKSKHHVLEAPHPSPMANKGPSFAGCGHFSQANQLLSQAGLPPIDWTIPN